MPRDGANVYTLPEAPFVSGAVASATAMNSDLSDIATALTDSFTRAETTAYTRTLLDDANAAAARTTLGVSLFSPRNVVINGNFRVNQRSYTSGAATSGAGQFTLDRWSVVTSGQNISWTDSAGIRTVTAPAGGMTQVIEGAAIVGDTYTLTWTGTATAQVNGASVANGAQVTLTGNTNVTLRFFSGTVSLVQLERGSIATPFEWRHPALELMLCQRYFYITERAITVSGLQNTGLGTSQNVTANFPVRMRTTPTVSGETYAAGTGNASQAVENIGPDGFSVRVTANGAGDTAVSVTLNAGCAFSAEL